MTPGNRLPPDAPIRRHKFAPEQMLAIRRHRLKQLQEFWPPTINGTLENVTIRLLDEHGIHRDQIGARELQDFVRHCFFVLESEDSIDYWLQLFAENVRLRS